jgi:hypothetical protein
MGQSSLPKGQQLFDKVYHIVVYKIKRRFEPRTGFVNGMGSAERAGIEQRDIL